MMEKMDNRDLFKILVKNNVNFKMEIRGSNK